MDLFLSDTDDLYTFLDVLSEVQGFGLKFAFSEQVIYMLIIDFKKGASERKISLGEWIWCVFSFLDFVKDELERSL